MKISKRLFFKHAAALGIGVALLTLPCSEMVRGAYAFNQSPAIPLFGTALRGVGPGGIPVALPGPFAAPVTGVTHYQIGIIQFEDQITPTGIGLGPTALWGYAPLIGLGGNIKPTHLGGIIIGKGHSPYFDDEIIQKTEGKDPNKPIQITFHNELFVNKHLLPVDTTIPGANQAINRTAIHLHGGLIPWISDGGPFDWFGPIDDHGLSFLNNKTLNPIHLPGAAEYYYPLNQSARFMWYHDHAFGITRLNAYAGLASALLVRDGFEAKLVANNGLPGYIEAGGNEIPLVFQDKIFVDKNIDNKDPGWRSMVQKAAARPGSLWYAHTYEPTSSGGRWEWGGGLTPPDPSSIPEFFGDTMLVNGTTFPQATVQARRYRLRMLNACNARFLNLQLYYADSSPDGITLDVNGNPTNDKFINNATLDASWLQIGTEGGFLAKPVKVPSSVPFEITDPDFLPPNSGPSLNPSLVKKSLVVAPAERPDLIVDFNLAAGRSVILYNDAPAPFPSGDDRNDYFPQWNKLSTIPGVGNPVNGMTQPGSGPNTRVLMKFVVTAAKAPSDLPLVMDETTVNLAAGIDKTLLPEWGSTVVPNIPKRFLTLNEYFDEHGRLIQILGNAHDPFGSPYDGTATYLNYGPSPSGVVTPVGFSTEKVKAGDTEVWEVYNNTADVHPMHFHLVNVQLINRQTFDPASYGTAGASDSSPYTFTGGIIPPADNEVGWKETVPMYPGTVTRVIMKWDTKGATIVDANLKPVNTTPKGLLKNLQLPIVSGQPPVSPRTGGYEYVWHCHILEHEEHDMMHAVVVSP